jgi:predicted 2-oxoglutarate/Fe(II)-dependent dioxygenase YbiX
MAVLSGFLDAAGCRRVRLAMELGRADPAEILAEDAAIDDPARNALSIEIDASAVEAVESALDAARPVVAQRCGLTLTDREGVGFIRYRPGGFYRRHRDRATDSAWAGAALRRVSVVLFLNSGDFTGGELVLYPGTAPIVVVPREGTLVAFDAEMPHEVQPVTGGTRDVAVDWYY